MRVEPDKEKRLRYRPLYDIIPFLSQSVRFAGWLLSPNSPNMPLCSLLIDMCSIDISIYWGSRVGPPPPFTFNLYQSVQPSVRKERERRADATVHYSRPIASPYVLFTAATQHNILLCFSLILFYYFLSAIRIFISRTSYSFTFFPYIHDTNRIFFLLSSSDPYQ